MLQVYPERENTLYVPGSGWFQVSRPETRWVFETVPFDSTVHTRWRDLE